MKTLPKNLKIFSDVVDKQIVKKTLYKTLNTKVNNLENKIPDASTLIQKNQYNTGKQNLEKKTRDVENKIPDISGLATIPALNTKIIEVKNKMLCSCY